MTILAAILGLLLLPHGRAYVRECRELRGGCEAHAVELEHAITGASVAHDVDPRLLTAIAYHESSLTGRCNAVSCGTFGFNRRGKLWRRFRAECGGSGQREPGTLLGGMSSGEKHRVTRCLDIQADIAAMHLRELLLRCGSWDGALSAYQSGYCRSNSGVRYARAIARVAGEM